MRCRSCCRSTERPRCRLQLAVASGCSGQFLPALLILTGSRLLRGISLKVLGRRGVQVILTMTDIVKKTGVRQHAGPLNVGSEFYEALDDRVKDVIATAAERARANDRRTVKARDV